eukprot:gnl/TRDRNA2_/TRDRNA2_196993_c0_seq1.p1 gnl/TRDRNA2_/TRDRNA2_196993_c0~~gnl/TRDRNA2_/TRDRNA2_196993_c0_seq1.p1  ORF type:complete len:523 (+),score=95.78 gnl/TRDRNA2_/TRDRNA2_196993_c0_seq1:38-1606(+)
MAGLQDGNYEAILDDGERQQVAKVRWMRVTVACIGSLCLILLSCTAVLLSAPGDASEDTDLVGLKHFLHAPKVMAPLSSFRVGPSFRGAGSPESPTSPRTSHEARRGDLLVPAVALQMPGAVPETSRAAVAVDCGGLQAAGLRVAITGASNGIGLEAARKLYHCGAHVIVLNRNAARVQASIDAILDGNDAPETAGTIKGLVCDLASLTSVNAAADALASAKEPIDVLCLNAGVQYIGQLKARITMDGFEQTLQTNHLGHVLLAMRLLPTLARSRRRRKEAGNDAPSRIVLTASQLHNPETRGGGVGPAADLGSLAGLFPDAGCEILRAASGCPEAYPERPGAGMVDGGAFNPDKMYKDTKLCNIFFMYELVRQLEAAGVSPSDIAVNAFSPGLMTKTGLFRHMQEKKPMLVGLLDFAADSLFRFTESPRKGGLLLANMAANPRYFSGSSGYWSNEIVPYSGFHKFKAVPTSTEAQDAKKAARLYDVSAHLVGIDATAAARATAAALHAEDASQVDTLTKVA